MADRLFRRRASTSASLLHHLVVSQNQTHCCLIRRASCISDAAYTGGLRVTSRVSNPFGLVSRQSCSDSGSFLRDPPRN